jgi:hypothetical protein
MSSIENETRRPVRRYVAASGLLFVLLLIAHAARAAMAGPQVFTDVAFALSTLIAAGFCVWAYRTWRRLA